MKKASHQTPRESIGKFQEIVNIGPAFARDFKRLGFNNPSQLAGRDPLRMYHDLCQLTGVRQDPCVLDVFIATTDYMNGNPPQVWWHYTKFRKQEYGDVLHLKMK